MLPRGIRFHIPDRGKSSLFSSRSGLALGPTQPPILCVPRFLSPGVKLNTNLRLVRNLKLHGAERLFALHAFTAYRGTVPNVYVQGHRKSTGNLLDTFMFQPSLGMRGI